MSAETARVITLPVASSSSEARAGAMTCGSAPMGRPSESRPVCSVYPRICRHDGHRWTRRVRSPTVSDRNETVWLVGEASEIRADPDRRGVQAGRVVVSTAQRGRRA